MNTSKLRLARAIHLTCLLALGAAARPERAGAELTPFSPVTDEQREMLLMSAPAAPNLPPELELKLVDFVECTASDDLRAYADDGFADVRATPMGTYRETGVASGSFFAYRLLPKNLNKPHLVIAEYPDDKERTVALFMHEDGMRGEFNTDFHIEGGYSTGGIYPNTDAFCTFQCLFWPATEGPALVCSNQHHGGAPAALSRIWLYEIVSPIPPAPVNEPEGPKRKIGVFFEDTRMFMFNFGRAGGGVEHCMEYLKYTGQNLLAFDAILYSFPKCKLPSIDSQNDDTARALEAADLHGIDVLAVFDPTSNMTVGGKQTGDLTDDAVCAAWVKTLAEFVDKYGAHSSLTGISFGGPAGCNRFASPKFGAFQADINAMLQRTRPDIEQHVFFGYRRLHAPMFMAPEFLPSSIIAAWEDAAAEASFADVLARAVKAYYRSIHLNVADYADLPNVRVHRSYYPNDHRCFRFYPIRTPRHMIFRDFNTSDAVTALTDTGGPMGACLFGNYFEANPPMFAGVNFWWDRTWIGPQISPAEPFYLEMYTIPLAQMDYPVMLSASWVNPAVGAPHLVRRFAQAFRSLPAKPFDTAANDNFVVARQLPGEEATYMYLLNNHPTEAEVSLLLAGPPAAMTDLVSNRQVGQGPSLEVTLPPYALLTYRTAPGRTITDMAVRRSDEAFEKLRQRIARLKTDIGMLRDPDAPISPKYRDLAQQTATLFNAMRYQQASEALGYAPPAELDLLVDLTRRKAVLEIGFAERPPVIDGDLADWIGAAGIAIDTPEQLVLDHWLFNLWSGPADLSGEAYVAYDDENLYLAFEVIDDKLIGGDEIRIAVDRDSYRSRVENLKPDLTISIPAPVNAPRTTGRGGAVAVRTDSGYNAEIAIPLATLGAGPGEPVGLHVSLVEMDMDPENWKRITRGRMTWRRETILEWPVNDRWKSGRDPQSAGELQPQPR